MYNLRVQVYSISSKKRPEKVAMSEVTSPRRVTSQMNLNKFSFWLRNIIIGFIRSCHSPCVHGPHCNNIALINLQHNETLNQTSFRSYKHKLSDSLTDSFCLQLLGCHIHTELDLLRLLPCFPPDDQRNYCPSNQNPQ